MKKVVNCTPVSLTLYAHSFYGSDPRECFKAMLSAQNTSVLALEPKELKANYLNGKFIDIDPLPETDDYLIVTTQYAIACHVKGLDIRRFLRVAYDRKGDLSIERVLIF